MGEGEHCKSCAGARFQHAQPSSLLYIGLNVLTSDGLYGNMFFS